MIRALFTAATGMEAEQTKIDNIAHNMANVNTAGYKRGRVDFQDLLYETIKMPGLTAFLGSEVPTGIQIGQGTRVVAINKIHSQGGFHETQNELDLAVEGDGLFQITLPDGTIAYTRSGSFKINSTGTIVNSDGYAMDPAVTIPDDTLRINIGSDGTVSVLTAGTETPTEVGNIELVKFINPSGLRAVGRNLFLPTQASGTPTPGTPGETGLGTIAQGFLENSNVNIAEEMINMIIAQRAYETNSKVIQTANDMLQTANQLR